MKVLVADDSGVMRKIIIRSLNAVGISDVVEAADGAEGWEQLQANSVDLVLTDWNMPNVSGLDFLRKIASQAPTFRSLWSRPKPRRPKSSKPFKLG